MAFTAPADPMSAAMCRVVIRPGKAAATSAPEAFRCGARVRRVREESEEPGSCRPSVRSKCRLKGGSICALRKLAAAHHQTLDAAALVSSHREQERRQAVTVLQVSARHQSGLAKTTQRMRCPLQHSADTRVTLGSVLVRRRRERRWSKLS